MNGYGPEVVDRAISKIKTKEARRRRITLQSGVERSKDYLVLPYLGQVSSKIGAILSRCAKKDLAYIPLNRLSDILFNTKDPLGLGECSGIYKIYCRCGKVYVGQTGRNFEKRLKEHKAAVNNFAPDSSAVARHFWRSGCEEGLDWGRSKVVLPSRYTQGIIFRKLLEIALETRYNPAGVMNDTESLNRVELWMSLAGTLLRPTRTQRERKEGEETDGKETDRSSLTGVLEKSFTIEQDECLQVRPLRDLQEAVPVEKENYLSPWTGRLRPTGALLRPFGTLPQALHSKDSAQESSTTDLLVKSLKKGSRGEG